MLVASSYSGDFTFDPSAKRIRTQYAPFKPLSESTSLGSLFNYPTVVSNTVSIIPNVINHDTTSKPIFDPCSFSSFTYAQAISVGVEDLEESFIERMLIGLKENKKILIPSSHESQLFSALQNSFASFDSTPQSPSTEDRESSSSARSTAPSSLRSSPLPENAHMTLSPSSSSTASSSSAVQDKTRDTRWREHFEELEEFKRDYGHTNVTQTKSKTLAEWVKNQRRLRKAGKLAQARITKLDEIGFEWDRSYLFKNRRSDASNALSDSTNSSSNESEHTSISSRKRKSRSSTHDPSSDGDYDS